MKDDFSMTAIVLLPLGLVVLGFVTMNVVPATGQGGAVAVADAGDGAEGAPAAGAPVAHPTQKVTARFETSKGNFVAELYPDKAPNTVANFVYLATEGFYDGLTFHGIYPGYLIQGGAGSEDPPYYIRGEFAGDLKHNAAGILSMACAEDGIAYSQFFITLAENPDLDGQHAVFGKVTQGLDKVKAIGEVETYDDATPVEDIRIKHISIQVGNKWLTKGQPAPQTLPG